MVNALKVLMVVGQFHPITGGTEKECQKLAGALIRRKVRVTVLTQHCAGLPEYELIEGIPVYRKMKGWHLHEYTYMLSVFWFLVRKVREYDIIQCFGLYLYIPPAVLIKYLFRKRVVARIEGAGAYGDFHRIKQLACSRLILAAARKLDRVISIAGHIAGEIAAHGLPGSSVITIPNSVDSGLYCPAPDRGYRKTAALCFVGRLAEEKGLAYLIRAMAVIAAQVKGVSLVIVGEGELRASLEVLREALCLQHVVFFSGKDDVLPHYRNAGLFVLPSLSEGLSLSLLEAMACGLPVIATDVGGNREVLDPRGSAGEVAASGYRIAEHGILVKPADVEGLAHAALRLCGDADLAGHLGRSARAHVERCYGLAKIADEYLSLYRFAPGTRAH